MSVYLLYVGLAHTTAQELTLCLSHTFCITYITYIALHILYTHMHYIYCTHIRTSCTYAIYSCGLHSRPHKCIHWALSSGLHSDRGLDRWAPHTRHLWTRQCKCTHLGLYTVQRSDKVYIMHTGSPQTLPVYFDGQLHVSGSTHVPPFMQGSVQIAVSQWRPE